MVVCVVSVAAYFSVDYRVRMKGSVIPFRQVSQCSNIAGSGCCLTWYLFETIVAVAVCFLWL